MTTLTLGTKFNTAKVTEMANMFEGTGHTAMTSRLNLSLSLPYIQFHQTSHTYLLLPKYLFLADLMTNRDGKHV